MPAKTFGFALLLALAPLAAVPSAAQTPASPHFEVASIKPAVPLQTQINSAVSAGNAGQLRVMQQVITDSRIDVNTLSLADLIAMAYRIKPYQLTAPDWMKTERFDVQATLPPGATKEQVPEMMQALLAERFKVKVHREQKPQPVYALVVAKDGPKLQPAAEATAPPPDDPKAQTLSLAGQDIRISSDNKGGQVVSTNGQNIRIQTSPEGTIRMEFDKATMAQFVEQVGQFLDKPVIDQTGLTGAYRIPLELSQEDLMAMMMAKVAAAGITLPTPLPGQAAAGQAATPSSNSSIFNTVQKLGLKLESRNLPVDTIVVDSAEKTPTEN
jgi:uncharacterized protein (TIGR03435 family)